VRVKLATRLLDLPLQQASPHVCTLMAGILDPLKRRRLVRVIVPLWVSPAAVAHLHELMDRGVNVLVANVEDARSVEELLLRAWHCDRTKFHAIGTTGVAGEEQLEAFTDEVRAGLVGAWASDDPADDDGVPVFVLLKGGGSTSLAVSKVTGEWPSVRSVVYTTDDPETVVAAIPQARPIDTLTPQDEARARGQRSKLNKSVEEDVWHVR
jgi:hypothetical protein